MPRRAALNLIWIPKNPAERAEALSAEIISGNRAVPHYAAPRLTRLYLATPHLDLHHKDASSEAPMLRPPVAQSDQLTSISGDLFNVAQVQYIRIKLRSGN